MYFRMNRDLVLVSLQGASVTFKKGEPTFAPDFLEREIVEKGGEVVDGPASVDETVTGEDRLADINAAFDLYTKDAEDPNKPPTIKQLHDLGAPTMSADERDAAWAAYKAKA